MKRILNISEYVFTPSSNQVRFTSPAFKPERLLAVIDTTTGKLVFSSAGQTSGFGGTFSTVFNPFDTLTYNSSNVGQDASDVLQIIYDDPAAVQPVSGTVGITGSVNAVVAEAPVYAADGTPILSTYDALTGEDGLNTHQLSSAYGGQVNNPLPMPNQDNALSVGFLNGGVLVAPAMDPVTNELKVQGSFTAPPLQDVNITQVNGNALSGSTVPTTLTNVGGSGITLGQNTKANSLPVTLASDQGAVPVTNSDSYLTVENFNSDILGLDLSGTRNNQLELSFNTVPGASLITNTTTGQGSIIAAAGHTYYQVGTSGNGSAIGQTVQTVKYRPGHEIYAMFTAGWGNVVGNTNASSIIGLFNTTEGFAVGVDQGVFGLYTILTGVRTFVPRTLFNTDDLTGAQTSKFTREGYPEAIQLGTSNLFRIRFAWLGSANILFEIFSPDGEWVLFHNIRQPNSSFNPSITNPNLPMRIEMTKTAGSLNPIIVTACWAAGTTSFLAPITETLTDNTLATLGRSVIVGQTTGMGGGYVNVKVAPSGSLVTDASGSSVTVTGGATSALQTVGNDSLSRIEGGINSSLVVLEQIANPISIEQSSGRMRVVLDPLGGTQTLGAVTTVTTVTTLSNITSIGGTNASSFVFDTMQSTWAMSIRGRII